MPATSAARPLSGSGASRRAFPSRNELKFAHLNPVLWRESSFMRTASGTPSIVPHNEEDDVYVVEHDPGPARAEVNSGAAGFEPVVMDLLTGRYTKPVRVVVFNVAGGWCRDASVEIAHELRRRCDLQLRDIPFFLQDFVDRHEGRYRDIQLLLPMRLF